MILYQLDNWKFNSVLIAVWTKSGAEKFASSKVRRKTRSRKSAWSRRHFPSRSRRFTKTDHSATSSGRTRTLDSTPRRSMWRRCRRGQPSTSPVFPQRTQRRNEKLDKRRKLWLAKAEKATARSKFQTLFKWTRSNMLWHPKSRQRPIDKRWLEKVSVAI